MGKKEGGKRRGKKSGETRERQGKKGGAGDLGKRVRKGKKEGGTE